jgi:transposase
MRPKGTSIQLEVRRRLAISLLETGWGVRKVARHVNASPKSVRRWREAKAQNPDTGLQSKPHPGGRQPRLHSEQQQHLIELLHQGARAHGFQNQLWTLARVATVIERHFAISYCPSGVWRLLKRLGWSAQKPEKCARERDEEAIAAWPKETWEPLKKKPGVSDAHWSS